MSLPQVFHQRSTFPLCLGCFHNLLQESTDKQQQSMNSHSPLSFPKVREELPHLTKDSFLFTYLEERVCLLIAALDCSNQAHTGEKRDRGKHIDCEHGSAHFLNNSFSTRDWGCDLMIGFIRSNNVHWTCSATCRFQELFFGSI